MKHVVTRWNSLVISGQWSQWFLKILQNWNICSSLKSDKKIIITQKETNQVTSSSSISMHERLKMSVGSVQEGNSKQKEPAGEDFQILFDSYDRHHARCPQLDKLFNALWKDHESHRYISMPFVSWKVTLKLLQEPEIKISSQGISSKTRFLN